MGKNPKRGGASRGGWRGRGRGAPRGRGRGRGGARFSVPSPGPLDEDEMLFRTAQVRAGLGSTNARGRSGRRGGRGSSMSVTSQNRVPFNYATMRQPSSLPPLASAEPSERTPEAESEEDEGDEDVEDDSDEDVVITPHKRYAERDIERMRRIEGVDAENLLPGKQYDFAAAIHHVNPLRRPIAFVRATIVWDSELRELKEDPARQPASKPPETEARQSKPSHPKTQPEGEPTQVSVKEAISKHTVLTSEEPEERPEMDTEVAKETPAAEAQDSALDASAAPSEASEAAPVEKTAPQPSGTKRGRHVKAHLARHDSDIDWGSDEPDADETVDFIALDASATDSPRGRPMSEHESILADWMENAMIDTEASEEEQPQTAGPYAEHVTLEDIAVDAGLREQEAFMSSDESDASSETSEGEESDISSESEDVELAEYERYADIDSDELERLEFQDSGSAGDDEEEISEGEDEEDEEEVFGEAEDEDRAERDGQDPTEQELLDDLVAFRNQTAEHPSDSDGGLDPELHALFLDSRPGFPESESEPEFDPWDAPPRRGGRRTYVDRIAQGDFDDPMRVPKRRDQKPQFEDTLWAEELQARWEQDRASKRNRRRARAEAREAAALNPYPNTHGRKSSRKQLKQLRRADKKGKRSALKALANTGDDEAIAEALEDDLPSVRAESLSDVREAIERFLRHAGHSTLALPPMRKRERAHVHNLANAYSIKSKSRGKGHSRFTVLYKTRTSGRAVNRAAVERIVRIPTGPLTQRRVGRAAAAGGATSVRVPAPAAAPVNREGARVGGNARRIGEENVGHQLLASMGWTSGSGLGSLAHGMAEPLTATVKVSRGGLGF